MAKRGKRKALEGAAANRQVSLDGSEKAFGCTARQAMFARAYVSGHDGVRGNGTAAAREAGYGSPEVAASRMLRVAKIAQYIAWLKKQAGDTAEKAIETYRRKILTREELKEILSQAILDNDEPDPQSIRARLACIKQLGEMHARDSEGVVDNRFEGFLSIVAKGLGKKD